ncbi:hypothetical protein HispidOSU_019354 [Sigmodon hispidus]
MKFGGRQAHFRSPFQLHGLQMSPPGGDFLKLQALQLRAQTNPPRMLPCAPPPCMTSLQPYPVSGESGQREGYFHSPLARLPAFDWAAVVSAGIRSCLRPGSQPHLIPQARLEGRGILRPLAAALVNCSGAFEPDLPARGCGQETAPVQWEPSYASWADADRLVSAFEALQGTPQSHQSLCSPEDAPPAPQTPRPPPRL